MIPRERLTTLIERHAELEHMMSQGDGLSSEEFVTISKEYADLTSVVKVAGDFLRLSDDIAEMEELLADDATDAEMRELAELASKSQSEAFEIVNRRVMDSMEEFRQLADQSKPAAYRD